MAKKEEKVFSIGTATFYMSYKDSPDGDPIRKIGYVRIIETDYDEETDTEEFVYYLSDAPRSKPVVVCYSTELEMVPGVLNEQNANARQDFRAYRSLFDKNFKARNFRQQN